MTGAGDGSTLDLAGWESLCAALARARDLGFLGPGPVDPHVAHSAAFATLVPEPPTVAVDLGSGGGLPGLVLATLWPGSRWILIDARQRRAEFLVAAVDQLGLTSRVEVRCARAEAAGRDASLRAAADLVVARSFGPPPVTAECAAPFLRVGGHLVVAEPPGGSAERWPVEPLSMLGLAPDASSSAPVALERLVQVAPCPDRFPRRPGIPAKRPLYSNRPG